MSYHGSWIFSVAILADVHLRSVRADCYSGDRVLASESPSYHNLEPFSCGEGTNNCCVSGERWTSNGWIEMKYCGDNIYCDGSLSTCCDTGSTYFVDPMTGEVKDASEADSVASAIWWDLTNTSSPATSSTMYPESTSSITTSSASETSTTSTSSDSTPPSLSLIPHPAPPPSTRLSPGATAGIGVGCGVAVISVGILAWLLIRRRKKSKSQNVVGYSAYVPPEHQVSPVTVEKYPQMSYVQPYREHEVTHELDEGQPRAELHTTVMKDKGSKQ
ncbi:hypothetical protein COCVIDRAFT_107123 [Bipolaris victoriae FI3]|uniref:Mid2 domain-containing protein n=1 Tax=Bipolaris victoriae (strain FI3) TaxID=930091 RepID=W7E127_BIPV3|nr:hypothetical protein COCVIDRAFT_107123 [Bipolaris victoriae FI3]